MTYNMSKVRIKRDKSIANWSKRMFIFTKRSLNWEYSRIAKEWAVISLISKGLKREKAELIIEKRNEPEMEKLLKHYKVKVESRQNIQKTFSKTNKLSYKELEVEYQNYIKEL